MALKIKLLIIDDHQAVVEGYRSILSYAAFEKYDFEITSTYSCEDAFKLITNPFQRFDVILLDMILPPFASENIYSGEELAILIKKRMPETKIIILTSHTESFELFNLKQKINPEGLLVKSDFSADEFIIAFVTIIDGETYHSITAKKSFQEFYNQDSYLDAYNRRIISLLAKGISTKNIPTHLNLTLGAIDKRKVQIKVFFNIQKGNDEDIIREARKKGYI